MLSVLSNPEADGIYYILLAAIGAVSGVFAYYRNPGGQGDDTLGWFKLIMYKKRSPA